MKLDLYLSRSANLLGENRLIKTVLVVMLTVSGLNHLELRKALDTSRTIVLPSVLPGRIEYTDTTPDDEYFKSMAREISYLAFNYTPATARSNFADLLRLYAPAAYRHGEESWYDLAARIEEAQVAKAFQLTRIEIDHNRGRLELLGQETEFQAGKAFTADRNYVVRFDLDRGRFRILQVLAREDDWQTVAGNRVRP